MLEQVFHHGDAADLVLEVGILNTGFNDIQWSSDGDGSYSTRHRGNEVLRPSCLGVVSHSEDVVLCHSRGTEKLAGVA